MLLVRTGCPHTAYQDPPPTICMHMRADAIMLMSCACLQHLPDILASSMPGVRKLALELAASALKAGPGSPPKHVVPSALELILSGASSSYMLLGVLSPTCCGAKRIMAALRMII